MTITHHASEDMLMAYVAGALPEGFGVAIATHLAMCPACRRTADAAAEIGGALLGSAEGEAVVEGSFEKVMAKVRVPPAPETLPPAPKSPTAPVFPEPLRSYALGDLDSIRWRRLGLSAKHFPIRVGDGQSTVRLLRIPAGQPVPVHGHRGPELTLVLRGCLVDGEQRFHRGDIEFADPSVEHQPAAGGQEDCICLAVTDAPLRFKSGVARLAQPFLRI